MQVYYIVFRIDNHMKKINLWSESFNAICYICTDIFSTLKKVCISTTDILEPLRFFKDF